MQPAWGRQLAAPRRAAAVSTDTRRPAAMASFRPPSYLRPYYTSRSEEWAVDRLRMYTETRRMPSVIPEVYGAYGCGPKLLLECNGDLNRKVRYLLDRFFPDDLHRRAFKVDRIKMKDALPITNSHVKCMTDIINRTSVLRPPYARLVTASEVSEQIRKYTYRKRKAFEFRQLPCCEQEAIRKLRRRKAQQLRVNNGKASVNEDSPAGSDQACVRPEPKRVASSFLASKEVYACQVCAEMSGQQAAREYSSLRSSWSIRYPAVTLSVSGIGQKSI